MRVRTIKDDLTMPVMVALAESLGFQVSYDRTPGTDAWTLASGHGENHVQHVGTQKSVSAFLQGFDAMRLQTVSILNEIDGGHRKLVDEMRDRLEC